MHSVYEDGLLKEGYAAIHAVGRASVYPPQLIDLRWGDTKNPKVTLVGKGVCFDSGGLNIKGAQNMATMKKDMAGAAHVLGLAHIIMALRLPVCLRVLIPAVENAISGDAYHQGDVLATRKGMTVEITNTDAEGRVILCEALDEAAREKPDLLLDFASLTGAARVALGTEVAALFTPDDQLAAQLTASGQEENDPVWRLPIYAPYRKLLDSKIADIVNSAAAPYGGAITAAIFLKEFVPDEISWAHFDIMAWNVSTKPTGPEGGEANALRAVARYLYKRFPVL
jgi:leucyl aminopeptidase